MKTGKNKYRYKITDEILSRIESVDAAEMVHKDDAPVINDLLDVIEKHQLSVSQAQRLLSTTERVLPQITFLHYGHNIL